MLGFFRRIINSRLGVIITLGVLAVIAIAFAAGDVTGLRTTGMGGLSGNSVAKVGGTGIGVAELRSRVQAELDSIRQQQPSVNVGEYIAQGGLDANLDQLVTGVAFEQFAAKQGMVVSKRSVDGQLASIPGLQGPNGKFDPATYQRLLADRHLTDAGVRADIARQMIAQQLILPVQGATQVPDQVAVPYASLLLERREGLVGMIPDAAGGTGAAPTDAEVATFYKRNANRYTVAERRQVRYAVVTPDAVKARAAPTDAEIATAYSADKTRFAATQKRTVEQVIALDQATANTIANKVRGGASLADAARSAGLEASTQAGVTKAAYAGATAPAVADAVFAAAKGALVGPVRAPIGWAVARVTATQDVAGKTLDQARGELVEEVSKRKTNDALASMRDAIDGALGRNATFDEVVADQKLSPQTTPALVANGSDPLNPGFKPTPVLAPVLQAAFQAEEGDDPQIVPTGPDGSFAVVALGRVIRAAPRPLAEIRSAVARDFATDRAHRAAHQIANGLLEKVKSGMPLAQALAAARLPAPRPAAATRAQLGANPGAVPPALALMFSMAQGTAKMLEVPQVGWAIVRLNSVTPADATKQPAVVAAARGDLARNAGRELAEQFARAVRTTVGVKIDAGAVARLKADLTGANGSGAN
ncbi:peptidyl-prolyl cis-trans isomerase D [Sphingomonas gellani]|uniref:Parvulin-like PPIase n=1 Tax=Sphingomonas gellani TaxID=1166340 RepID=A0A1H8EN17_9SPHN|nr:peptidylprolyl isomerase [Sphingomonas gellani]SEN20770.1 peptidyl-prolyl cis-trans isomerase D [Sphingomonas gellani]